MSEHQISLPDNVYENLLAVAAMEGMTPADWIAAHVPHATATSSQQQSLYDLLADLAGAINDDDNRISRVSKPSSMKQPLQSWRNKAFINHRQLANPKGASQISSFCATSAFYLSGRISEPSGRREVKVCLPCSQARRNSSLWNLL